MSKKHRNTFLFLAFFLVVGLSCNLTKPKESVPEVPSQMPAQPTQIEVQPTEAVVTPTAIVSTPIVVTAIPTTQPSEVPTDIPTIAPTQVPTNIPTIAPTVATSEPFYIEEFDLTPKNWSYFMMSGNEIGMNLFTDGGELIFDLQGEDQWVYYIYDDFYYEDVYIETVADNRGKNNNNVSLICRYTDDEGWYEFNISNNGLYWILAYSDANNAYNTLFNGGSTAIKSGKDINYYAASCEGNTLTLYINEKMERQIVDNTYKFRDGQVGVGVSSFDTLPILVNFDYFLIDLP